MRINITVTDEDIRNFVELAVASLEEENQVSFPDTADRVQFLEDCTAEIIDKIEMYDRNPVMSDLEYEEAVLDAAELYGFLCE